MPASISSILSAYEKDHKRRAVCGLAQIQNRSRPIASLCSTLTVVPLFQDGRQRPRHIILHATEAPKR